MVTGSREGEARRRANRKSPVPLLNPSPSAADEACGEEMALYLLFEAASGYALFYAYGIDEIGQSVDAVRASVLDLQRFGKAVKLAGFAPFSSAVDALNQCNAISEGPLPPTS